MRVERRGSLFLFHSSNFSERVHDPKVASHAQELDDVGQLEKIPIQLVYAFEQAEKEAQLAREKAAAEKVTTEKVAVEKAVKGIDIGKGIDESTQTDEKEAAEKAPAEVAVAKENQGIDMGDAFKIKDFLVVSHRWEELGECPRPSTMATSSTHSSSVPVSSSTV